MAQRLTYRRRLSYNTPSNKTKVKKTPGGKLVFHYVKKRGKVPRCGDTGVKLHGITAARPRELSRLTRRHKTVTRVYGGVLCPAAVKERIIRAFLCEEQKIVAKVIKSQKTAKN
ncbi:unnamed protein product, partial [Mesorhabditis spiculigera]